MQFHDYSEYVWLGKFIFLSTSLLSLPVHLSFYVRNYFSLCFSVYLKMLYRVRVCMYNVKQSTADK